KVQPAPVHLDWLRQAEAALPAGAGSEQLRLLVDRTTALLLLGEEGGWSAAQRIPDDAAGATARRGRSGCITGPRRVSSSAPPLPVRSSSTGTAPAFYGVDASGPTDVWAVGVQTIAGTNLAKALVERWDGTAWQVVPGLPEDNGRVGSVYAAGPSDV
ncbi:MAG TPA: hypothetical protein VE442_23740, partial [Jatrophihabitans sp.]|nr:hypothetical protein [Jatrophihabitans sp.]